MYLDARSFRVGCSVLDDCLSIGDADVVRPFVYDMKCLANGILLYHITSFYIVYVRGGTRLGFDFPHREKYVSSGVAQG